MTGKVKLGWVIWLALSFVFLVYLMGYFRSQEASISFRITLLETLIGFIVIGFVMLIGVLTSKALNLGKPNTKTLILILVVLVMSATTTVEMWCGYEEAAFVKEAKHSKDENFARPRWTPYSSAGLVFEKGKVIGHD